MSRGLLLFGALLSLFGCGTSQQFPTIPPGLNRDTVPHQTFEMTAERFHFTPEELTVKHGTLVTVHIRATNGTHGFNLGAFGIDETIEEGEAKTVEFYAGERGEYSFRCSHFCGIGHLGMTGKLIVE